MAAHNLIKLGIRKSIGNGESTHIWYDPWLYDDLQPYAETLPYSSLEFATVASLLVQQQHRWDLDLVHDIFTTSDANIILGMPLPLQPQDGTWY
ncbi:conserved hypothetical protein [Ricinus communis]|uniref:Reverse transcriptase zinc-binding domain-containing protein n=1 Tax=Ricinus communis TaxID=3988 RepID=B9SLN6_RICCO|nr:conserved hypothetical protein [Ricinus communis]